MTQPLHAPATANYSVIPAVVTRNDDADQLGRVKVRFPWMDEQQESDWVHVAAPTAGKERGFFFVPEIDDLVLIAFAYGRIDRAYVIGSLWSTADRPPAEERTRRTIKSVSGHAITLDDTEGAESISIVDKTGKNKIVLDAKTNTITVESDGELTLKARGKLALSSDDDVSIRGKNVAIEATGKAALGGTEVAIDGPSGVNVNSGALEVI
jgi:phage baseplate assembly protein V